MSPLFLDEQQLNANWNFPTTVRFGLGRAKEVCKVCKRLNINKPLLVTDAALVNLPPVTDLLTVLEEGGLAYTVFSDVKSNPTGDNVVQGLEAYKGSDCDGVIAVGGGSGLDAGKSIALMAGQSLDLFEFEDRGDNWRKVDEAGVAPLIALPTTAGTGSEVGRAAVIVDESCDAKKIIFHPKMMPAVVICDPLLTKDLPAHLTAATGMDALVHNLEAFFAPGFHPMADGIAVEGIRIIFNFLQRATDEGGDLQARSYLLVASSMGATAFQKGLGGVHALAHPLGALFDKHHGLLNAIILPYVLKNNRTSIEEKMTYLARCLALPEPNFDSMFQHIIDLRTSLNIPNTLAEIGLNEADADKIAPLAFEDTSTLGNPCAISVDDYKRIYINACTGSL